MSTVNTGKTLNSAVATTPPLLALALLGLVEARWVDTPITVGHTMVRALLAYLAVQADRPHSRELLASMFWPDHTAAAAYTNLRQTLARLRKSFVNPADLDTFLIATPQTLQFSLSGARVDVAQFTHLLAESAAHVHSNALPCPTCHERFMQAAALYRGDLLHGLSLKASEPFEEWLLLTREKLHRQALDLFQTLTHAFEATGDYAQMHHYAARQLALEPWCEEAHRQCMRAFAYRRQRTAALAQYETCCRVLRQEFGIEPEAETQALYERIQAGELLPVQLTPALSTQNEPAQLTPPVRHEGKLVEMRTWLQQPKVQILTPFGADGMGKTGLAVETTQTRLDGAPWTAEGAESGRQATPLHALPALGSPALSVSVEHWEAITSNMPMTEAQEPHDRLAAIKLHPPRLRTRSIARAHLAERLQQGMACRLTLLSAPAGFGKTTLLAQWLTTSGIPVAWLSLDPHDNDPVRFFTYIIAALQTCIPLLDMTILRLLEAAQATPLESALTVLANELLKRATTDFALVLDDYHVITIPAIHQALTFLIDHLPPQMHLILASRADPPLPLARLRARGNLVELRADTLRLKGAEVATFLRVVGGLDLPAEALPAIERRTEGWAAGLQLAALSLQDRADVPAFLAAFTGSHRFVFDYLSEEVFFQQPEPIQSFLLHTSILERLCGSLCEAVTGESSSQAMLEALERANLFVVSLDDERRWYRYHQLFAEMLENRLQQANPKLIPELHRRACNWYEQQGLLVEAVEHALSAHDAELVAGLIERTGSLMMVQGRPWVLLDWLKALPDSLVRTRPLLCAGYAAALHVMNYIEEAEAWLQDSERALSADTPPAVAGFILGNAASTRANLARYVGDLPRFLALVQQALDVWPETVFPTNRTILIVQQAYTFLVSGEMTPATEQQVRHAVQIISAAGYQVIYYRSLALLARFHLLQGQLRAAASVYEQVEQADPGEIFQVLAGKAPHCFGLGDLLREWNRLDEAELLLIQGMEQVRGIRSSFADEALFGHLTLARLQQARGLPDQAVATLEAFVQLADLRGFASQMKATATAVLAQLALAQSNLKAALRWADASGLTPSDTVLSYPREREYLTLSRVRIAQGRENPAGFFLGEAGSLLARLLGDAEAKMRKSSVLEIRILQALVLHAQHNHSGALTMLGGALTLAEPEGYIRLFVDEGKPMQMLLEEAQARGIAPNYLARLVAACGERDS